MTIAVRAATPDDVEVMFGFIVELATYERAPEQVVGTPALLAQALFGERPSAEGLIGEADGLPAGFAIFHSTFSTWTCRAGIWLEDLYVSPDHRRTGLGGALLSTLTEIAVHRGCPRVDWVALDWNEPALAFYRRVGAQPRPDWLLHRLAGDALARVAAGAPGAAAGPAAPRAPAPDDGPGK